MDSVKISAETPASAEARQLIAASDAYVADLYPSESNHLLDLDALLKPEVTFIVARLNGCAVGCGAIVMNSSWAEIKRMFVMSTARGKSVGRRLLQDLEERARKNGIRTLRLETGVKQPEALNLYRASGYTEIGPFAEYLLDPLSVFMEKRLTG